MLLASGDLDLLLLTLTFILVRERDQTCLPCEFGANRFGGSRDVSDSKKVTDNTNNRTLCCSLRAIMMYVALPAQKFTKYMVNFHWWFVLLHGPSAQVTVLYSAPVMMGHADKRLYGHFTVSMTLYLFLAASQNDVDAACCYRLSSVVCVLICLSVSHDHKPCKTAEPVEMPFGL